MAYLRLKLKLITPLLMFGAFNGAHHDPHPAQPEIRAASIRGGLRYWLRAVYGAAYGKDIEGLHEAESRIFGSTSRGSAVTVRVQHSLTGTHKREFVVLPEKVDAQNGKVDHKFPGFSDSSTFELSLISHPLRRDVFTPAFTSALLLAFTLGGFGKRARRGGGALQIVGVDRADVPDILRPLSAQNGEALAKVLTTEVFPYIERAVASLRGTPYGATAVPSYPIFAPDHCRVFVGKQENSDYLAALRQMWVLTGKYHRQYSVIATGQQVTTFNKKKNTNDPIPDEWAWGYALNRTQIRELNNVLGRSDRRERRASALHMRAYQCSDGQYYPIITIFRGGRHDEKWDRVQEVIDLFDDPKNNFLRVYGSGTKWTCQQLTA